MKGRITMTNPLYQEQMNNNINNYLHNPLQFLTQRGANIPQQYANDPHGFVQYLLNNNKISQSRLNQAIQQAQQMGIKL